jgi:hypothetical protein
LAGERALAEFLWFGFEPGHGLVMSRSLFVGKCPTFAAPFTGYCASSSPFTTEESALPANLVARLLWEVELVETQSLMALKRIIGKEKPEHTT